jgi:hypothetical protein
MLMKQCRVGVVTVDRFVGGHEIGKAELSHLTTGTGGLIAR